MNRDLQKKIDSSLSVVKTFLSFYAHVRTSQNAYCNRQVLPFASVP
jgi:hypothetical protein